MHLTNCLHPVDIKRGGDIVRVPCGKCIYCRHIRNSAMSTRLDLELQSHKFNVFGTLTYADMFLPRSVYSQKERGFIICKSSRGSDFIMDDELFDFQPFPYIDEKSNFYIKNRMAKDGFIPILDYADFQKFMKRLRISLKRTLKYSNEEKKHYQITYACVGEYGPTTFRPHFHFLLMFDNEAIAKIIFKAIHTCWSFGSSRSRWLNQTENSGYITKYINCTYSLPNLFKTAKFRPKLLVSKSHPIGIYQVSKEEIQTLVYTQSPTIHVKDSIKGSYTELPLWKVFEDRFFPKFTGFDRVPDRLRTRLLGAACEAQSFKEFCNIVGSADYDAFNSWFVDYKTWFYDSDVTSYLQVYVKDFSFDLLRSNCLKSIYYCAKRIVRNMHEFCINSVDEYLDIILKYYQNKEFFKLKQQYLLEDAIMRSEPQLIEKIDLMLFDDSVVNSHDMKPLLDRINKSIRMSHKNKLKNEYLRLHPEYDYMSRLDDFRDSF